MSSRQGRSGRSGAKNVRVKPWMLILTVSIIGALCLVLIPGSPLHWSTWQPPEEAAVTPEEVLGYIEFSAIDISTGEVPDEDDTTFEGYVNLFSVDISSMTAQEKIDLEFTDYDLDASDSDDIEDFQIVPDEDYFYLMIINSSDSGWSEAIYRYDDGTVASTKSLPLASINKTNYVGFVNWTESVSPLFYSEDNLNTTFAETTDRDWICHWKTNDTNEGIMTQYDIWEDQWSYLVLNVTFNQTALVGWVDCSDDVNVVQKTASVNSTIIYISGAFVDEGSFSFRLSAGVSTIYDTESVQLGFGSPSDTENILYY